MENLVIAVLSRGRPYNTTFRFIEKAVCPIYVFVHEPEYRLYKDAVPEHFEIVSHNEKDIGAIRFFIQERFAQEGKTVLMMDDDISAVWKSDGLFKAGINELLESVANHMEDYEALGFDFVPKLPDCLGDPAKPWFFKVLACMFVLSPSVFDKGVVFTTLSGGANEDMEFSIQCAIKDIHVGILPFSLHQLYGKAQHTYFGKWFYTSSILNLYEKYGNIMQLTTTFPISGVINYNNVAGYKHRGGVPVYSKQSNKILFDATLDQAGLVAADPMYVNALFNTVTAVQGKLDADDAVSFIEDEENTIYWNYVPFDRIT
jgi:hypothetical protein